MPVNKFGNPTLLCDLVMKGGITSGVVYPLAVCRVAETYSFKNIGGASAGAIAAAAAAAAECGRRSGFNQGFELLEELPKWIGSNGRLLKMFQPDGATASLFRLVLAGLGPGGTFRTILRIAKAAARSHPFRALLGAAPGVLLGWMIWTSFTGWMLVFGLVSAAVLAIAGFVLLVAMSVWRQIRYDVPANFYGLSTACDPKNSSREFPLTNWLTGYLNELANRDPGGDPLTFGDLYRAGPSPAEAGIADLAPESLNLEMMTTALNHTRPYRLPFRDPDQVFFFEENEFLRLFPERVVRYMIQHAPKREGHPQGPNGERLIAFPEPEHVPVVVATRMSLSFPVLLSAVPLYAVDFTRPRNQDKTRMPVADRCWFSDGGACSNLPIHFFDSAIPRWPTFGINLKQFHPDFPDEDSGVWMPNINRPVQQVWSRFEAPGKFGDLGGFLGTLLDTMQNWQDTMQMRIPGVRDRLVHVSQRPDEGGMNLDMPPETIERLSRRGERAGQKLVDEFKDRQSQRWMEHRWARFRAAAYGAEQWLMSFARGYHHPAPGDAKLAEWIEGSDDGPRGYRIDAGDREEAKKRADALGAYSEAAEVFGKNNPRPAPELRLRPRV